MSAIVAPPELQRGWVVGGSLRNHTRVNWQTFPWRRTSIIALLGLATILYVWDLGASGWRNGFYAGPSRPQPRAGRRGPPSGGLRFGPGIATGAPPAGAGQFAGGPPGFFGAGSSTSTPFGRGGFGPGGGGAPVGQGRGGAGGGLLSASTPSSALVNALQRSASSYTWVAATVGANSAAGYQLATDDPVMATGGFNGTDPTPTLSQFQQYVSQRQIHYFIAGGGFGPGGGSSSSSAIATWVQQHFTSTSIGGVTVYDLTSPLSNGTSSNAG